jgi:hypothetical protein
MTRNRIDLLKTLSNKREIEELTREEKKLYKELLEEYENHAIACNIAHDRAEI